jgi:threonine/homoserine/homoserine lactone efflux protein
MTTVLLIAAGVLLLFVLLLVFMLMVAFWLLHRLERFLKGHKTVLNTIELLATVLATVIGLRNTFTTNSKKTGK